MTPQSLHRSSSMPLLRTSSDKAIDDIGKTEKGQTIQILENSTISTKKLRRHSVNMAHKDYGHHEVQINSTTLMPKLMSKDLRKINNASNITEHTIFTSDFQKSISTQFAKEIENLSNIVESLGEKLNNETDPSPKIAIYDALKEINGFITRYQNTGLGGFDKVKTSEIATSEPLFKNLPKVLENQTSDYKTAKQNLENKKKEDPKNEEKINQLQTQIEKYETEYKSAIKEGILRAQEIVAKNLKMLTALIKDNDSVKLGTSGQGIEQTFNILQGNAMSGWIINDIVPKLEKVDKAWETELASNFNLKEGEEEKKKRKS